MRMGSSGLVINANKLDPIAHEKKKKKMELGATRRQRPDSLEELHVITLDSIEVDDTRSYVRVTFTPTNTGCGLTQVIGVCLRVKLTQSLPSRYKIDIRVAPGSHQSEAAVNKQLNDKERVAAALESPPFASMIRHCLSPHYQS
ncbi:unnamed protein product [Cuscuta campestris]|uniref:MIP18 family-like domain-containing protein n=1 Tax=Cuscuta campestris TaxID=132261 RepID=A0A484NPA7_9ASTE|nr:unnamed protein product [Cuscuta campestris]